MADDSKEIIKADKEQLGESKQQTKSLSDLVKDMKQQSKNVKQSVTANVDVNRSIKGLEGFMGMDATEQTTALKDELKHLQSIMNGQVELQKQGLPFNQQLLDESQKQLEVLQAGVKSEEEKREAIKKQDEANSILMSMKSSFEKGLGAVKDTGGFLAGIAGLATLVLNPDAFAKAVKAVLKVVSNIADVINGFATGGLAGGLAKMKEHFGSMTLLFGVVLVAKLGKILSGLYKVVTAVKKFSKFMKGTFVKDMLTSLSEKMKALGGTLMKPIKFLVAKFKAFRVFMTGTFIPTMITSLKSMMSSVGGALIKGFNFLKNSFLVFRTFMTGTFIPNTISALGSAKGAVGGGFIKAFGFLQKAFMVFRGFMMTTVVPTMVGALSGIGAAMAPMLAALAPILVPVLAIAAVLGALALGLKFIKDKMGFSSIMDTLKFSFLKFADFLAGIINMVTFIPRKLAEMVLKTAIGRFLFGDSARKMAASVGEGLRTDRAEKFKEKKLAEKSSNESIDETSNVEAGKPLTQAERDKIAKGFPGGAVPAGLADMLGGAPAPMPEQQTTQAQLDEIKALDANTEALRAHSATVSNTPDIPEVIAIKPEAIQPVEKLEEKPKTLKGMFTQMQADGDKRIENIKQLFAQSKEAESFGEAFSIGMDALKNAVGITTSPEIKMEATEPTAGTQMAEMSAENLLANMPATTENNVVNQVSNQSTQNSGNTSTTIIQSSRPSRTADMMRSNRGSFAR